MIERDKISPERLRKAQLEMLSILNAVDKICRNHEINYWLEAGTLLGAVRHKGFIPWDDDIDLGMMRDDYKRFLRIVESELPENLYLQTEGTDRNEMINRAVPCKIRMKNTRIEEAEDIRIRKKLKNKGIFLDVFPMDRYSKFSCIRKIERSVSALYYFKYSSYFNRYKNLNRKIIGYFFRAVPFSIINMYRDLVLKKVALNNNKVIGFGVETVLGYLGYTSEDDLFPLVEMEFEGQMFFVPQNSHNWLCKRYGESYNELPPQESRTWHSYNVEFKDDELHT